MDDLTLDRFARKIRLTSKCWEWIGTMFNTGYGRFHLPVRNGSRQISVMAHRFSYEAFVGPIPTGLQIDHLCFNRRCVRPEHLEPVTARENLMRSPTLQAKNVAKTTCPRGHPYDDVVVVNGRFRKRQCTRCRRERDRLAKQRQRARCGTDPRKTRG